MIRLGGLTLDPSDPLVQVAGGAALVLVLLLLLIWRAAGRSARAAEPLARQLDRVSRRLTDLTTVQAQLSGGLAQVTEAQAVGQAQMQAALDRRLADVTRAMGDSLQGSATRTARSLGDLHARLETIDKAQANIEKLSGDVLGLQDILSNKQARGAFGELQLSDLVQSALPPDAYGFQMTLSNGRRADCLIRLPHPPGPMVIDSKFPLEPYEALLRAESPRDKADAARALKVAVRGHVKAIAERYIIEGETADSALMFVPSEAVYAALHAQFPEVVREGFAARVWLVSPTTCMATLNTLRAVLKDLRMREQAGLIRRELTLLAADVDRLSGRVDNLDRHFAQAARDVGEIRIAADKVGRRARRLDEVDFDDDAPPAQESAPDKAPVLPLISR